MPAAGPASPSSPPGSGLPSDINTLVCELCSSGQNEAEILLCDCCDRGYHLYCLMPPLAAVPEGDWLCPRCARAEAAGALFADGGEMGWPEFEEMAAAMRKSHWGSESKAKKVSGSARRSKQKAARAE